MRGRDELIQPNVALKQAFRSIAQRLVGHVALVLILESVLYWRMGMIKDVHGLRGTIQISDVRKAECDLHVKRHVDTVPSYCCTR